MTDIKMQTTCDILWNDFLKNNSLNSFQLDQFKEFFKLLEKWNNQINLTNIINLKDVINYHFDDSLAICKFVDFQMIKSITDIGTGGGFPGIPLKIKYPHLNVVLIEVNSKKRAFLEEVINTLSLTNIEIYSLDWRTFLRKTNYEIDLFVSRASLHTDELIRIFMPSSPYKDALLVYWASFNWQPSPKDLQYLKKEETYKVGSKKRKLIFFKSE